MPNPKSNPAAETAPEVSPLIYPLDDFYARSGHPLPKVKTLTGDKVPEPYRTLLVHHADMTPTLESFYADSISIKAISTDSRGDFYFREVILYLDGNQQPVEFGAIKINLALFQPNARRMILEEHYPLGHILAEFKIPHSSNPKAFLEVVSDDLMSDALGIEPGRHIYGRRNTLKEPEGRPLAEVVELLPPAKVDSKA